METPMREQIAIADLWCYQNATDEERNWKYISPTYQFDLSKIESSKMREEVSSFLIYRGQTLKLKSIRAELLHYNRWVRYAQDNILNGSLSERDIDQEIREYKKWMIAHGYKIAHEKKRRNRVAIEEVEEIRFYRRLLQFCHQDDGEETQKDIWNLDNLTTEIYQNPIKQAKTISFKAILQDGMREETKNAIALLIKSQKMGTIQAELTALKRFSAFMRQNYVQVSSFAELDREMMEAYLIYLNTEGKRKSYRTDLEHLKTVIEMIYRIYNYWNLNNIILSSDIGKAIKILFRDYSNDEIMRLNSAIIKADVQIGRAWVLQGLLGTRITETLSLRQDSIIEDNKLYIVQSKSGKGYTKYVSNDVVNIINKAAEYTTAKYGKREYIFVAERNPDMPMPYGTFYGRVQKIIEENDLRDDSGRRFTVGTHLLRHSYGRRLAELGYDDTIIAALLGHSSLQSVQNYRKLREDYLAKETMSIRAEKDEILRELLKRW